LTLIFIFALAFIRKAPKKPIATVVQQLLAEFVLVARCTSSGVMPSFSITLMTAGRSRW
jgi:hypothetical protein